MPVHKLQLLPTTLSQGMSMLKRTHAPLRLNIHNSNERWRQQNGGQKMLVTYLSSNPVKIPPTVRDTAIDQWRWHRNWHHQSNLPLLPFPRFNTNTKMRYCSTCTGHGLLSQNATHAVSLYKAAQDLRTLRHRQWRYRRVREFYEKHISTILWMPTPNTGVAIVVINIKTVNMK